MPFSFLLRHVNSTVLPSPRASRIPFCALRSCYLVMGATELPSFGLRASYTRLATIASLIFVCARQVAATCYYPNGNLVTGPGYVPCNNSLAGPNAPSMCCGLKGTGAFPAGEGQCLPNGLCKYQQAEAAGNTTTQFWRNGCSSKDWKGDCLDVCGGIRDVRSRVN